MRTICFNRNEPVLLPETMVKPAANSSSKPRLRLRVTSAAEAMVRGGHPWVFSESIREQNREGTLGELAVIYDRRDRFLAVGLYEPESPLRVRVLHTGKPATIDRAWWSHRLREAVEKRKGLFSEDTNGYRLVNGESDGWPGLVLDRYGGTLVVKVYSGSWLPRLEEVISLITEQVETERIVLRLSRNLQEEQRRNGLAKDGEVVRGNPLTGPIVFMENGLRFEADVLRGQKTGFFLDQRDNRSAVGELARGRLVLNAFSFSGGFSLYAARGGAESVIDLDISAHALESAKRNFALNRTVPHVMHCRHELIQADTFEWLQRSHGREFGLIVLDPPSLAKRETERSRAIRAYGNLAGMGIQQLSPGGVLVACSCSAHVTALEFFDAMRSAARKSGRRFKELKTTGHSADHPATFKEAEYLKAIYLQF
jgi:23S rRNA (cytosine1962-C5)-methyltransferase